jgi:hypothetical protein
MDIEPPTMDVYGEFLKYENVLMAPHIGRENEGESKSDWKGRG